MRATAAQVVVRPDKTEWRMVVPADHRSQVAQQLADLPPTRALSIKVARERALILAAEAAEAAPTEAVVALRDQVAEDQATPAPR